MDVSEQDRRGLYDGLAESIGAERAGVLMELLPRSPSGELVTRTDMQANTIALRGEMAEMRAQLTSEMAELRADLTAQMADLRTELSREVADLRTELRGDTAELRTELRGEMADLRVDIAKWLITAFIANAALMAGLVVLVWRLAG